MKQNPSRQDYIQRRNELVGLIENLDSKPPRIREQLMQSYLVEWKTIEAKLENWQGRILR